MCNHFISSRLLIANIQNKEKKIKTFEKSNWHALFKNIKFLYRNVEKKIYKIHKILLPQQNEIKMLPVKVFGCYHSAYQWPTKRFSFQ